MNSTTLTPAQEKRAAMRRLQNLPMILRVNCRCCCHEGEPCPSDGHTHPCCAETVTFIVNGAPRVWRREAISFFEMVTLALGPVPIPRAEQAHVTVQDRPTARPHVMGLGTLYNPNDGLVITVDEPKESQ